jgi:thioredoxin reductase
MNDIIVIGGGPNGIYCFKTLKQSFPDKNIVLIEKSEIVSNIKKYPILLWHSPMHEISFDNENKDNNSYPSNNTVVSYYTEYFIKNKLEYLNDNVIDIKKESYGYDIFLENSEKIKANSIIICTGIFENKNKLSLNHNFSFVTYDYPDFTIKNKNLVLIGGGNSAIDYIIYLLPNNKITWILMKTYTRNSAHLNKFNQVVKNNNHNLCMYENTTVKQINENNSILLSNSRVIDNIDICNILIGFTYKNKLCDKLGIEYTDSGHIKLNENYETNKKNIFVFGSLSTQKNDMVYIHNGNPRRLQKIISAIN